MKRQIAKGLTMLMLLVGLAFASASVANGQSGKELTAQVPFDFIVAEKTLRSGQYRVSSANSAGDMLAISRKDGGDQVMRLSHAAQRNSEQSIAKLVFRRYGSTYFLGQVWMSGDDSGRELAKTRQERAIARELKTIAAYHGDTKPVYEIVVIAAAR